MIPLITIALCTWNRCEVLKQCLLSLEALEVPAALKWEVVVIDNNSQDDTPSVLGKFAGRLPVRPVIERRPGASHARNRALAEARGELILWTDDDAVVDKGWLTAHYRAMLAWPGVAVFGGPIEPRFERSPPRWLQEGWPALAGAYATRDLGHQPIALDLDHVPYGPNFAVRTQVHRRFSFDTSLGPTAGGFIRGEETALVRNILRAGFEGRWVPDAHVQHFVPQARQTLAYLRRYYIGAGEVEGRGMGRGARLTFGRPRWLWRRALEAEWRYRLLRATRPAREWVPAFVESATVWGRLKGAAAAADDAVTPAVSS